MKAIKVRDVVKNITRTTAHCSQSCHPADGIVDANGFLSHDTSQNFAEVAQYQRNLARSKSRACIKC